MQDRISCSPNCDGKGKEVFENDNTFARIFEDILYILHFLF